MMYVYVRRSPIFASDLRDASSMIQSMELTIVLTTPTSTHTVSRQPVDQMSILPAWLPMVTPPHLTAYIPLKTALDMVLACQIVVTPVLTAK